MRAFLYIYGDQTVKYVDNIVKSRLTLIKRLCGGRIPIGLYQCECGKTKEIRVSSVNGGITKSCGCLQVERRNINAFKTHGLSKHPIYRVWNAMKDRCYREKSQDYPDYGGRGVVVCAEWVNDFKAFYDWSISNGWQKGLQIDKDIKAERLGVAPLLYAPDRCMYVTAKENSNKRRSNRVIEYNGEKKTLNQWATFLKINRSVLRRRLQKNKWVLEKCVINNFKNTS